MRNFTIKTWVLLLVFQISWEANAQPGSLDLSFGNNGKVTTQTGSSDGQLNSMVIQPDGKIIVAGFMGVPTPGGAPGRDFVLFRYKTNGSLDTTFGVAGKIRLDFGNGDDYAYSVKLQPDGKILVAGSAANSTFSSKFALVRYNANGSPDNAFGGSGTAIVKTCFYCNGNHEAGRSLAIQTDGKLLVTGFAVNNYQHTDFSTVRYNTNGSVDSTFDSDGKVTTSFGTYDANGNSLAIQSDGKIVVAGCIGNYPPYSGFVVARYNTNGSLDSTFDYDGKLIASIGTSSGASAVVIQSDDKILVAGYINNGSYNDYALLRYNTDGSLDTTFDNDGKVITSFGANSNAYALAIQSDGKILMTGSFNGFTTVRYNTNGSVDSTFNNNGIVTTSFGASPYFYATAIAIQPDGKIVSAGSPGGIGVFGLARYKVNPCTPTATSQSAAICAGQSFVVGNSTYTANGTYTNVFNSLVDECDSIVTTNLTVNALPILTTNVNGIEITANQTAAVYQWINCNSNTLIAGATNQSFTPTVNGDYAVIISLGSCADTSACVSVTTVGVSDISNANHRVSVYPNPFSISTIIESDKGFNNASIQVYNVFGQEVKQLNNLSGRSIVFYRDDLASGLYFMMLTQDGKVITRSKVMVEYK